jgi:hypothetical protein
MMRSTGRGGPTAEEMRRYHENRGPAARAAMADKADQDMLERMGREYDRRMPSPEPGEPRPKRFAKGGVTRADGCVKKGHTKGKMR